MKAVILAAGEGKRIRPLTYTRPKPMIPIGGKPHLQIILEDLRKSGITEVILIVGYLQEIISGYFQDGSQWGLNIEYITQTEQLGTGHATLFAKDAVQSDPFLLINGDIMVSSETFTKLIKKFKSASNNSFLSVVKTPDPASYGIIQFNKKTHDVTTIIEKPSPENIPKDSFTNAGLYLFNPNIFDAIQQTPKSPRGEIEITDSIQRLINQGNTVKCFEIEDFWLDIGKPWDLLDANQHLLNKTELVVEGIIEENVRLIGKVGIGKGTIVRSGSYLVGPLFIGEHSDIGPNCYIRDYCSIGNNVRIGHACELKNSMVFDGSKIPHLSYIGDSIIGSYVNLGAGTITANLRFDKKNVLVTVKDKKMDSGRTKMGTIIGDYAQTGIGTTIMPGVIIGSYSIIGSNAILQEDIPPNSTYLEKKKEST
ncbi:MAG TPA: bifunctional sugar-1-phosphate nucleotidylyltransferase/acetyltransferase [Candidatus Deferrimicrobium sp.]|nr:bifunctional sugar-1-phosphate nucleotidylyltransferase/acetyltransferase [Candidatus Deferrimicrobium sp.]